MSIFSTVKWFNCGLALMNIKRFLLRRMLTFMHELNGGFSNGLRYPQCNLEGILISRDGYCTSWRGFEEADAKSTVKAKKTMKLPV